MQVKQKSGAIEEYYEENELQVDPTRHNSKPVADLLCKITQIERMLEAFRCSALWVGVMEQDALPQTQGLQSRSRASHFATQEVFQTRECKLQQNLLHR